MQRNWSRDVDAAPVGWLLYVCVPPEYVPEGVSPDDLKGFRLDDGWYVLDANWKRVRIDAIIQWAEIERRP